MARTLGSPNKNKAKPDEIAKRLKCDPFEVLIYFIQGDYKKLGYKSKTEVKYTAKGDAYESDIITPEMRLNSAKEAVKYLYSQHKAVEHSNADGSNLTPAGIILVPTSGQLKP